MRLLVSGLILSTTLNFTFTAQAQKTLDTEQGDKSRENCGILNGIEERLSKLFSENDVALISRLYKLTNEYMEAYEAAVEYNREALRNHKEPEGVSLKMKGVVEEGSPWYKGLVRAQETQQFAGSAVGEIPVYPPLALVVMLIQSKIASDRITKVDRLGSSIIFHFGKEGVVHVEYSWVKRTMKFTAYDMPCLADVYSQQLF